MYNSNVHNVMRNAQGDVVGLVDNAGNVVVEYTYDAWGKPLSTTGTGASSVIAQMNPFRYRYIWDSETGLYYLNQKYYNPEWGRFINADDVLGETGILLVHNLFAYCGNNPVMNVDPFGQEFWSVFSDVCTGIAIGLAVVAICRSDSCDRRRCGGYISTRHWMSLGATATAAAAVGTAAAVTSVAAGGMAIAGNMVQSREFKRPAKRYDFSSKKAAKEAAKKSGGDKKPIHHPEGKDLIIILM